MTGEIEPRRLHGGPLDGETIEALPGMTSLVGVECPWGPGEVFHFASAEYDQDGNWVETRCTSTDGEPLREGS